MRAGLMPVLVALLCALAFAPVALARGGRSGPPKRTDLQAPHKAPHTSLRRILAEDHTALHSGLRGSRPGLSRRNEGQ